MYLGKVLVAWAIFLFFSCRLFAQESNCNAFMLGNYLEIGVNWNGAFGASTTPPVGSHPTSTASLYNTRICGGSLFTGTSLGFVADPEKNGWTFGSPNYFGDYILPGAAQEGWSVMADGVQKNAWNYDAASADSITGLNCYIMSYLDSGGQILTKTQAVDDGLYITQFITLDTSQLYFTVQVLVENTSLAAISDIYYMRTINPHNDQILSGVPQTWNKIEYQTPPDTANRAIVSARGTMYNSSYLAIGTNDFRGKAFITKNSTLPNAVTLDLLYFEDTNYTYTWNDSILGNTSIGLVYDLGTLTSGTYAVFTFFYAFRPDVLDDAIHHVNQLSASDIKAAVQHYTVYPNPVTTSFKVTGLLQTDELVVYDMRGSLREVFANSTGGQFSIAGYEPGTYVLLVKDKTGYIKDRLTLQKL